MAQALRANHSLGRAIAEKKPLISFRRGKFQALLTIGRDKEKQQRLLTRAGFNPTEITEILARMREKPGDVAATLIPSVGFPMGCNFCSTSAMFGGKGRFINFYETGDELFDVMCGIERDMSVQAFFAMDENFLLHKKRALRLLEFMEKNNKSWSLYVFSPANVLRAINGLRRSGARPMLRPVNSC